MTEKWDSVRVSRDFELSKFEFFFFKVLLCNSSNSK